MAHVHPGCSTRWDSFPPRVLQRGGAVGGFDAPGLHALPPGARTHQTQRPAAASLLPRTWARRDHGAAFGASRRATTVLGKGGGCCGQGAVSDGCVRLHSLSLCPVHPPCTVCRLAASTGMPAAAARRRPARGRPTGSGPDSGPCGPRRRTASSLRRPGTTCTERAPSEARSTARCRRCPSHGSHA